MRGGGEGRCLLKNEEKGEGWKKKCFYSVSNEHTSLVQLRYELYADKRGNRRGEGKGEERKQKTGEDRRVEERTEE